MSTEAATGAAVPADPSHSLAAHSPVSIQEHS